MDCYDFVMARAHEIVERRRQEEFEDNNILAAEDSDCDTDSDLLVLASSLFNGMEGIEYSSIDGGDMDSGGIELDSDDNDAGTTGIAFSPRKMRSGKVVGYYDKK
jgi:hypothetical protein